MAIKQYTIVKKDLQRKDGVKGKKGKGKSNKDEVKSNMDKYVFQTRSKLNGYITIGRRKLNDNTRTIIKI